MALSKLERSSDGTCACPTCGGVLEYVSGAAVSYVDGKLDMEAAKPKYECHKCGVFYREVLNSGFFDVFPLEEKQLSKKTIEKTDPCSQEAVALNPGADGKCQCPNCHNSLRYVEGGAVQVIDGKVNMDNVKPTYECDTCNVVYREVLNSGFYHAYPLENHAKVLEKKKVIATGDIPPVILKKDANGKCKCPRCGEMMNFVEGGAVTIVNGKPDMENVKARFVCDECKSVFRQIATTEYYQWAEK